MKNTSLPVAELETSRAVLEVAGAALGNGPGRSTLAAQRAAFLNAVAEGEPPRWRARRFALPAAAGALLAGAALAVWLLARGSGPVAEFDGRELAVRDVAVAHGASEQVLALPDGSRLTLAARAEVAIVEMSETHAELSLRKGRIAAAVRKVPGRTFSIHAGPYVVQVVGTVFSLRWEGPLLDVSVDEGQVLIRGGSLPAPGRLLHAGERFSTAALAAAAVPRRDVGRAAAVADSIGTAAASGAARTPAAASGAAGGASSPRPEWIEQARRSHYRDALALAEREGFERLTRTLGEGDLLLLANTARYAGNAPLAKQAFKTLRARFPGRPAAGLSALYLARIAEGQEHDTAAASRWLRTFLAESPGSEMAPGARASLIDIALQQGDQAAARAAAADYLKRYPAGPHAAQARAVLESSSR